MFAVEVYDNGVLSDPIDIDAFVACGFLSVVNESFFVEIVVTLVKRKNFIAENRVYDVLIGKQE